MGESLFGDRAEQASRVRHLDPVGEHVDVHGRAERVWGVIAVGQRVGDGLAQDQLRIHRGLRRGSVGAGAGNGGPCHQRGDRVVDHCGDRPGERVGRDELRVAPEHLVARGSRVYGDGDGKPREELLRIPAHGQQSRERGVRAVRGLHRFDGVGGDGVRSRCGVVAIRVVCARFVVAGLTVFGIFICGRFAQDAQIQHHILVGTVREHVRVPLALAFEQGAEECRVEIVERGLRHDRDVVLRLALLLEQAVDLVGGHLAVAVAGADVGSAVRAD